MQESIVKLLGLHREELHGSYPLPAALMNLLLLIDSCFRLRWSIAIARLLYAYFLKLLMLLLGLMLPYWFLLLLKVGDSDWRLRITTECISRVRVLYTAIGCRLR